MMCVARQLRGLSQTEMAKALGISQSKVSKIEAGLLQPDATFIEKLSQLLEFRPCFFTRPGQLRPAPANFHRKRQKLSAGEWDRILATSEIYRLAIEAMLQSVDLVPLKPPPPGIDPDQYDGRIDLIASAVRQAWTLPRGPVVDVAKAIEDSGVLIVSFDFRTDLIDAFCQRALDRLPPLIFLNGRLKSKDRIRFSLAHELGHLVMHTLPKPEQEQEANQFAAAFLMPAEDIRPALYGMSLERLMVLKTHWKASMQAILRRARDLNRVSDRGYRYYQIEMSKRGWRNVEPIEIDGPIEDPKVFESLLSSHTQELGYSVDELTEMFGIYPSDMPEITPRARPRLRLVPT